MKIERSFYQRAQVTLIARELLGKVLITRFDGKLTSGIITETEAYEGVTDHASHAFGGRFTTRTEIMYREGGTAYVYLCYGVHSLFNIVTNRPGIPHAVLIRSIIALDGLPRILERIGRTNYLTVYTSGPGKVSKALGLHYLHSGLDLMNSPVWLEDRDIGIKEIHATNRIGIDYAGEDALLPYRFVATLG